MLPDPDFTFIDLFAGIGGMRVGFEAVGGECVFTSEWNKYSQQTYRANFGDEEIAGDITQVHADEVPDHDVLVGGFPCQPFSIAGVSKKNALGRSHGFADETQGTLFFDVARIRELVELMKEHELQEIDLRESDHRIRLARAGAGVQPTYSVIAPPVASAPSGVPAVAATTAGPPATVADGPHIKTITSPMVGTFYSKANPNSPPFVKVGDSVNPESVVCIIEAMKVFNEISADIKGKVVAVLVDSETPVDFGRPLFKVDTSA